MYSNDYLAIICSNCRKINLFYNDIHVSTSLPGKSFTGEIDNNLNNIYNEIRRDIQIGSNRSAFLLMRAFIVSIGAKLLGDEIYIDNEKDNETKSTENKKTKFPIEILNLLEEKGYIAKKAMEQFKKIHELGNIVAHRVFDDEFLKINDTKEYLKVFELLLTLLTEYLKPKNNM
jgi:hypothetical protein